MLLISLFGLLLGYYCVSVYDMNRLDHHFGFTDPVTVKEYGHSDSTPHLKIADSGPTAEKQRQARIYLDPWICDLPENLRRKVYDQLNPLLNTISEIGIGESCYNSLAEIFIETATREDPEGVFRHLLGKGDVMGRENYYKSLFREWTKTDAAAAKTAVDNLPNGTNKRALKSFLFQAECYLHPQSAYEILRTLEPGGTDGYAFLFDNWHKFDPTTASVKFLEISEPATRQHAARGIALSYAKVSPTEALEWSSKLSANDRKLAVSTAFASLLISEPELASRTLSECPNPEIQREMLEGNLGKIAVHNPREAYKFCAGFLDGSKRSEGISDILQSAEPTSASLPILQEIADQYPLGGNRDGLVRFLAGKWSKVDAQLVYDWLTKNNDLAFAPIDLAVQLKKQPQTTAPTGNGINWGKYGR